MTRITTACFCAALLLACSNSNDGGPSGAGGGGAGPGTGGAVVGGMVGSGGTTTVGNGGTSTGNGGTNTGNGGTITGNGGTVVTGGTTSSGGTTGTAGAAGGGAVACQGQNLAAVPDDPSARGPWVVGVKTVQIDRTGHSGEKLTIEVEYPAKPGSEAGKTPATYDIRAWLPTKDAVQPSDFTGAIADSESPQVGPIGGNLFRDLPIDDAHGPYPVVIFMHGTASFRIASGSTTTQWASRGFVVLAADYPGLNLTDHLCLDACKCPNKAQDLTTDVTTQFDALKSPAGDLAFLASHVDMSRVGLSGHSVGGCTTATLASDPNVQIIMPLSSADAVMASSSLKSILFYAGMADTVFNYMTGSGIGNLVCPGATGSIVDAYTASAGPPNVKKRLVGVTDGGHLVPTDLCQTNAQGKNAIQVMQAHHWCGSGVFGDAATQQDGVVAAVGLPKLFDCGANGFDWKTGVKDLNYASTAALEETLQCRDRSAAFSNIKTALPSVGDFKEATK